MMTVDRFLVIDDDSTHHVADHRLQARYEATLSQILEILEIFSETGWPRLSDWSGADLTRKQ